nr:MAG TPA: hypothetical protein [Caudoviricetes sp.]
MQYVMINRKLCGNFGFSCMFTKCPILLLFAFFVCFIFFGNQKKTETETKKPHLYRFLPQYVRFCRKQSIDFQ